VFEHPPFRAVTFVLLHSYPYIREASWLAHVYPHVAMDLSLTVPFAAHGAADAIAEALAPASKVLLATDAFSIPELFWLAARHAREALDEALARIARRGFAGRDADDRDAIARRLLWENAAAIYGEIGRRPAL
jgi:predicted TIM-barrel fold metal-dependent hydrolase